MLMKFTHTDCVGNVTPIYIDIMRIAIIRTVPNDLGDKCLVVTHGVMTSDIVDGKPENIAALINAERALKYHREENLRKRDAKR